MNCKKRALDLNNACLPQFPLLSYESTDSAKSASPFLAHYGKPAAAAAVSIAPSAAAAATLNPSNHPSYFASKQRVGSLRR